MITAVIDNDVTSKDPSTSILRAFSGSTGELNEKTTIPTKASTVSVPTTLNPLLRAIEYAAFYASILSKNTFYSYISIDLLPPSSSTAGSLYGFS